jgi:heme A synthase
MSAENPPVRLLRRLAYGSAALTFTLMIVGGIVRVSESGLGCGPAGAGAKGWPLCGGGLIPGVDTHMIVEYTHRILVASLTVLLMSLVVLAFLYFRGRPWILRVAIASFVLLIGQAVLGALTVEHGLSPWLVATHLGVAMLTLGLLLLLCRLAGQVDNPSRTAGLAAPGPVRGLAIAALVATLGTIVAGGYMAAGDLRGSTPAQAKTAAIDAHEACGRQFPACNDAFLPFGDSKSVNIQLTHRVFMYLTSILIVSLFIVVMRRRRQLDPEFSQALSRRASIVLGILATQVLLGAVNVWAGEHEWLIVLHLTVGTALWSMLVVFTMTALGIRLPATASERSSASSRAVPA